ncbi:MAG TPA: Asp-tRNA(Asn)/Glu-tRNA(Gln) amidotransferase subunit GatA [Armatimonadota bacterium]|jgi:aspartyl-tRNA(Asn)/glutamyl-tRNA(Gln) amidotransferase subunit A
MPISELPLLTAHELGDLIRSGAVSPDEARAALQERIERVESQVQAFMTVLPPEDSAPSNAQGPLSGVPGALKDNMCTRGVRTTCSSKILHNWVPPYDACVTEKLRDAGMALVGKTNMDEFAMGSSTENSGFHPTHNPWNLKCVPGGSSGGSAAAVAAGEAFFALGSDTGGSIRQPASFCGVVGMKPTYGRVSRYGLVAFASSLDQIGPLTKDVTDCALVMNAIAGHDPRDSTSVPMPVPDYTQSLKSDVKGLRIGKPVEYFGAGTEPAVREAVDRSIDQLAAAGAEVVEVSLPHTEYALPVYYLVAPSECSSNLARFDGVRYGHRTAQDVDMIDMFLKTRDEGFGPEVKRRIMLGTYALSAGYYDAYYLKAGKVRSLIARDFQRAWEKVDILLTPTSPTVAFEIGAKANDPMQMYLSDICTIPVNLAGIPALSLPCGFQDGLPIGLQMIAKPFAEETLLRAAFSYEQMNDWHKQRPRI